jgi:hypothetical protein
MREIPNTENFFKTFISQCLQYQLASPPRHKDITKFESCHILYMEGEGQLYVVWTPP